MRGVLLFVSLLALALALPVPSARADGAPASPHCPDGATSCPDGGHGRWVVAVTQTLGAAEVRLLEPGAPGWPAQGRALHASDPALALTARLCTDGRGGVWVAWTEIDYVGTTTEVMAVHVTAGGRQLSGGRPVTLATFMDLFDAVALLPDGSGGVYVAWREGDANHEREVKLERLAADGATAPGWPAGGLALDEARGALRPRLVTDGEGGAIVVADADPNRPEGAPFAVRVSPAAVAMR